MAGAVVIAPATAPPTIIRLCPPYFLGPNVICLHFYH